LDLFDSEAIESQTYLSSNSAVPFVAQAKAFLPPELKPYFHQTLTSQDYIDTVIMLLKPALKRLNKDLVDVLSICSRLI